MRATFYGVSLVVSVILMANDVAGACVDYWDGTAPFCSGGPCKAGWHQTQKSNTGDGKKCWTGEKVYCQCDAAVNTCRDYWSGTAPFCKGECNVPGYHETARSNSGNGGFCFTGHKSYCQCDANTGGPLPSCVPKVPIKQTCVGFLLVCNNGCSTFGCGLCFSGFFKKRSPIDSSYCWGNTRRKRAVAPVCSPGTSVDDDSYNTLLTEDNAMLAQALYKGGYLSESASPSNETIVNTGIQVMESKLADIKYNVDTAASYPVWENPSAWVRTDIPEPNDPRPPCENPRCLPTAQ